MTGTALSGPLLDGTSSGLRGGLSDKTSAANTAHRGSPFWAGGALSMRRDQRKSRLLQEWEHWLQTQPLGRRRPTARDTLKFFYELQDIRSPLLDFRSGRRDKWRVVHDWLLGEERPEVASRTRST